VGVAILRVRDGFDCTGILADVDSLINKSNEKKTPNGTLTEVKVQEVGIVDAIGETDESKPKEKKKKKIKNKQKKDKKKPKETLVLRDPAGNELPKSILNRVIMFQKKQKKDYVDVWWLSDDGGTVVAKHPLHLFNEIK
jgi:solute carrier family 12 sodium/potassium/chloride transporter 2